ELPVHTLPAKLNPFNLGFDAESKMESVLKTDKTERSKQSTVYEFNVPNECIVMGGYPALTRENQGLHSDGGWKLIDGMHETVRLDPYPMGNSRSCFRGTYYLEKYLDELIERQKRSRSFVRSPKVKGRRSMNDGEYKREMLARNTNIVKEALSHLHQQY